MNEKPLNKSGSSTSAGEHGSQPHSELGRAREGARELAQAVTHTAGEVADQARRAAETKLSKGKESALDRLDSVANAIRKTGQHLREEDAGAFTDYFDRAARQVDQAADYFRGRSVAQVVEDVESFARGEPALFLGGAFLAGLLGGRFLKSSKPTPATGRFNDGSAMAAYGSHQSGGEPSAKGSKGP